MNGAGNIFAGSAGVVGPHVALGTFILFCRIGGCLMLSPGFSSTQIPMQIRLFIAVAATLALTPLLLVRVPMAALGGDAVSTLQYIMSEMLIGVSIGLLGRLFFVALETMAVASATSLGLSNPFGIVVDQGGALPPMASFISLSATALIFFTNLHWEILRGLVASYTAIPVSGAFDPGFSLRHISDLLVNTFRISLRVCSPFIIYAIVVNLAVSIINRLTPQIAIFYIAAPFVIAGGIFLFYFVVRSMLDQFMSGFGAWLGTG